MSLHDINVDEEGNIRACIRSLNDENNPILDEWGRNYYNEEESEWLFDFAFNDDGLFLDTDSWDD